MPMYETSLNRAALASAGWAVQLRAGTPRAKIREIGITLTTAVASELGLVRSATVGTATFTSTTPQAIDAADAAATLLLDTSTTGTAPTANATYLRRIQIPAQIGSGIIWTWDQKDPLIVAGSGGVLLWGISTTTGAFDVYVKHEE